MVVRNDPRQYDELAEHWWRPDGKFAMLHWLAATRSRFIPPANTAEHRDGSSPPLLVDVGCGGGLLSAHVSGYRHLGVDISHKGLEVAREHAVRPVRGSATALPLRDDCASVVVAGEVLEHVPDWRAATGEACRVLRPGGTLVLDTLADTALCRFITVTLGERVPGGIPRGIHDPALFVSPADLIAECARHGVTLSVQGLRPELLPLARWLLTRRGTVSIIATRTTSMLYAGRGVKDGGAAGSRSE